MALVTNTNVALLRTQSGMRQWARLTNVGAPRLQAIATWVAVQIKGMSQAMCNANRGISMIHTAGYWGSINTLEVGSTHAYLLEASMWQLGF